MKYCKTCVLPDTKPGVSFDRDGVCSVCNQVKVKEMIDWDARQRTLACFVEEARNNNHGSYDCVVPVSGGKDSMMQVFMMSKIYGLRVLAVNVVAHLQTTEGIENLNSLVAELGVDLIKINVRPSTHKKIRRLALHRIGNPNYSEHRVIFSSVARTALLYKIPLVVWGEDIGVEFGGAVDVASESDGSANNLINNDLFRELSFEELLDGNIPDSELFFYNHPSSDDIEQQNIKSIYLGFYQWWDGIKHYQVSKSFGFTGRRAGPLSGNVLNYDNIDEKLCEIHSWFKFIKLGFWRPTDHCCYKIWNGYMSREEGVDLVKATQYELPDYLPEFLEYHQMSNQDFFEQVDKWRNLEIWEKRNGDWRLKVEL